VVDAPASEAPYRLIVDVEFGDGMVVQSCANLLRLPNRDNTGLRRLEIQRGVKIGASCKIQSHSSSARGPHRRRGLC
jgi:hypothetical protein